MAGSVTFEVDTTPPEVEWGLVSYANGLLRVAYSRGVEPVARALVRSPFGTEFPVAVGFAEMEAAVPMAVGGEYEVVAFDDVDNPVSELVCLRPASGRGRGALVSPHLAVQLRRPIARAKMTLRTSARIVLRRSP